MKYLLLFSLGAYLAASAHAFWGNGFNLDVQNGVNVMHHGGGDPGNWRMAHSNDVGVMTMNHNGGQSMGVQVRNRLQLHWDPNQGRFVQKRSIEDAGPDAEVESADKEDFSGDREDLPGDQEDEANNIDVDSSDEEPSGGLKTAEDSNAAGMAKEIYPIDSKGLIWRLAGGRNKAGESNVGTK